MDPQSPLYFNGINAGTGAYLYPPTSAEQLARQLTGAEADDPQQSDHLAELQARHQDKDTKHLGVKSGINSDDLAQTGWAAVFPATKPGTPEAARQDAIAEALLPLFELRRAQATQRDERLFKIYRGAEGYRAGETKQRYLARLGAGPGPADPARVPYYLMIVASPAEIPFSVQYQLDVQYAVGRLHFETLEEWAAYAQSVVAAETGGLQVAREVALFGVANADDPATQQSARHLIAPLADSLIATAKDWKVLRFEGERASKAALASLLGGDATPALVFTASHGAGFSRGDPRQRTQQGALVCQDWPGPVDWREPLRQDHMFAGEDIASSARPHGLIMFNFACYGAGTPLFNDYGQRSKSREREQVADAPFLAALPQRLLSHPRGGALATIGHVERAWGCSFLWPGVNDKTGAVGQLTVFEDAMAELMGGKRVGAALEAFNERYAELASDLSGELEEISFGRQYDALKLADMWTANNDARGYTILGDPAVRLPLAPPGGATRRPEFARPQPPQPPERSEPPAPPQPATSQPATSQPATPQPATSQPATLGASAVRTAASVSPGVTAPESPAEFGLFGRKGEKADAGAKTDVPAAPSGFQQLTQRLLQTLERVVTDLSSVEIRTYVARDLEAAAAAPTAELGGHAELRAFTRISLDGDVDVCVPQHDEGIDRELWQLHLEMVKQAQGFRGELLRALLGAGGSVFKAD